MNSFISKRVLSAGITCLAVVTNNPSYAAEEFNNLTCIVGLKTEQLCNVAIHKRAMIFKFPTGRTHIVKLHKIGKWGYTNQSKLKGFIFTWVKHRHIFGISYKNIDGDNEQMAIAFNDSQYVQPFQFFLEEVGPMSD